MEKHHHHQVRKFRRPHTFDNFVKKIYVPTNFLYTTFKSFIDRSSDYMNCLIEEHRRRYGLICVIVRLSAEFLWKNDAPIVVHYIMRPQIVRYTWDFDVDELANFYVEPTDAT